MLVEYWRMWEDKTWDTAHTEVPDDTEDVDAAIQKRIYEDAWDHAPPLFVGVYHIDEAGG